MDSRIIRLAMAFAAALASCTPAAVAQPLVTANGGGGVQPMPTDRASEEIDAIFPRVIETARALGLEPPAGSPKTEIVNRATAAKLQHPLRLRPHSERFLANGISNFVDHDATTGLRDFACGTRTYDGHRGIDYSLGIYSWRTMDAMEVEIVAAAPGTIVERQDGQYDRQCNWNGAAANYVIVLQDDGLYAFYWHMKKNSVTAKPVGQRVAKGEFLGLIGSSGNSNGPHLHFELREVRSDGLTKVDPYAGSCASPASTISLWKQQHEVENTDITRLATHAAAPPTITYPNPAPNFCDNQGNPINPNPGYVDRFLRGATVYTVAYVQDQKPGRQVLHEAFRPDGTLYSSFLSGSPPVFYRFAYWYMFFNLPNDASADGVWRYRTTLDGITREHAFIVGTLPATTSVRALVDSQARSPRSNVAVTATVHARNTGATAALGCWVAVDYPLAATADFQRLTTAGTPTGAVNQSFSISPGTTQQVRLTLRGKTGFQANGIELPVRVNCLNAEAPAITSGYNTFQLSFKSTLTPDIIFTNPSAPSFTTTLPAAASSKLLVFQATNAGAAGTQVVAPVKTSDMPLTATICELNGANACISPYAPSVTKAFTAGGTARFRVRLVSTGAITLNELTKRVMLNAKDPGTGDQTVRGRTTFAVRTP